MLSPHSVLRAVISRIDGPPATPHSGYAKNLGNPGFRPGRTLTAGVELEIAPGPRKLALCLVLAAAFTLRCYAQGDAGHPNWPGPGQLFVGTCYQPVDRSEEQIDRDISIMRGAGFNVVRTGDLSWDSFEPTRGKVEFEWFDRIMDKMAANGIKVILDIPGSPAPIWLHRAYPGVDIVNEHGERLPPAERLPRKPKCKKTRQPRARCRRPARSPKGAPLRITSNRYTDQ